MPQAYFVKGVDPVVHQRAKARATKEGLSMSMVILTLVQMYADGLELVPAPVPASARRRMAAQVSAIHRFWRQVDPPSHADPEACRLWRGATDPDEGYGIYRPQGGPRRRVLAHAMAWELSRGPVPRDHEVFQTCRNPLCCNPEHLTTVEAW